MGKKGKKTMALLLTLVLAFSLLPMSVFAAEMVTISSEEDFLRFAKSCTLDSWSAGKTIELTCDIDLKHTGFSSVPIFSGTFEGNGHTISGVNPQQDGSHVVLFRYIEEEGTVKNLHVEGRVIPGGSGDSIGGIAGENRGTIENCFFDGTVEGKTNVGGIVGKNSGDIRYCSVSGEVSGKLAVGGIVGENEGFLMQCENHAAINTAYEETQSDLTSLDTDAAAWLENYKANREEYERNTLDSTDIGGIVGASDGIVQGCKNYGAVGYPHTGYNIGGVVGRQSGYLLGCENHGTVYGRKDVGGIVGQAEPYFWLSTSEDTMDTVRAELEALGDMADRLLEDADALGSDAEIYLDSIYTHAETAGDHAGNVKDQMNSFVKDNEAELDAWTAELSDSVDDMEGPMDDLADGMDGLEDALDDLGDALSLLTKEAPEIEELAKIAKKLSDICQTKQDIQTAKGAMQTSVKEIGKAILQKDKEGAKQAVSEIFSQLEIIRTAQKEILSSLKEIHTLLQTLPESIQNAAETVNRRWKKALASLDDAVDELSDAGDDISNAMENIGDIFSDFADAEPEFVKLGDDFEASSDALFNAIESISDDMQGLRLSLRNGKDMMKTDLRAINNQFETILELLFDEVDALKNGVEEEDIFLDVSDAEIGRTRQGKIANSRNYGTVEGERNAGGIAGAMSIELTALPEADIEKPDALRFTYRMKVILQDCINEGNILGKKDCIGGVAGYGEIGTVYGCENYGSAESSDGNYAGGIIGKSEGTIRRCYAKGEISGGRYVGGIAGKAKSMSDCCSIAAVSGEENVGVVLGGTEELQSLRRNYFVEQELGAVDGISYAGKAEPISYADMKKLDGIPERFISFMVTFLADGEVVEERAVYYGEKTDDIRLPAIPEKEGYFGRWQPFETESVTGDLKVECDYLPLVTLLPSAEKNESGKLSLALAEGAFTDEAELHVYEVAEEIPAKALGRTVVYDILLEEDGMDTSEMVTLRLLNEKKETVSIWQKQEAEWVELETKTRGKYVVCEMEGTEGTLCLSFMESSGSLLFLLPVGFAAVGAAGFVLYRRKKNR